MPRNGSGTFALTGTFALANQIPNSSTINTYITDITTGLTESINKDGTKAFEANQSMGGFKLTSVGNGNAVGDSINVGQVQAGRINWADAGGTADAITGSYTPAITSVTDGDLFFVRASAANATTTPTYTPNSGVVTARTIVKHGNDALAVGDIGGDGHELILRYRSSDTKYLLLNPKGAVTNADNNFTADQTIVSTDAGSGTGPKIILYRNSATPAASDTLGRLQYDGEDSAGNTETYAYIQANIDSPTNTSEGGSLDFFVKKAGSFSKFIGLGRTAGNSSDANAVGLPLGQLSFPSPQNASSDSNTLDDYAEGAFTPGMSFNNDSTGVTYSQQSGNYTKIGRLVMAQGFVTLTSNGTGVGAARLTGLPFTSSSGASVGTIDVTAGGSSASGIYLKIDSSATTASLRIPGATAASNATDTNCTNTFSFSFQIIYGAS